MELLTCKQQWLESLSIIVKFQQQKPCYEGQIGILWLLDTHVLVILIL